MRILREDAPPDCMRCGSCCFSESERHARVTGDDHARLGDDAARLVVFIGNEAYMRLSAVVMEPGSTAPLHACAALAIDAARGTFSCAVYERRPQVCRDLERGGPACHGELAAKAERPKRALAMLREPRTRATS